MPKKGLNLLKESAEPKTFWEKFYAWSLSIGRFIIVGTEAIVLMVFLARFKLDRDINDLTDSLAVKKAILDSYKETEAELRGVQSTLENLSILREEQQTKSEIFDHILSLTTENTNVETLSISDNTLNVIGQSNSFDAFNEFEESFKSSDRLSNVTIPSTETEEENGQTVYKFTLNANVKTSET